MLLKKVKEANILNSNEPRVRYSNIQLLMLQNKSLNIVYPHENIDSGDYQIDKGLFGKTGLGSSYGYMIKKLKNNSIIYTKNIRKIWQNFQQ